MIILGIESSCDETAVAFYSREEGIIANQLFSQTELHKKYGGVVPEIASRLQLEKISRVLDDLFEISEKSIEDVDVIAVGNGPGLSGSLLVGVCFAKALAYSVNKKIIGVDHLEAHAFAPMLEHDVPYPHICLTASGGHTQISYINGLLEYKVIGKTVDDAAGEAFDKIAKMLGYAYPGGPIIEKLSKEVEFRDFFYYPRGKGPVGKDLGGDLNRSLNMSFSGLKTAVLYDLVKRGAFDLQQKTFLKPDDLKLKKEVASSLLICIADIFVDRINKALKLYPEAKAVTFSGGVACNKYIRHRLQLLVQKRKLPFFVPAPKFCTDNGAMIALVGYYKAQKGEFSDLSLDVYSRKK